MKRIIWFAWIAMTLIAGAAVSPAQDTEPKHGKHHKMSEWLSALSSDEQAKLRAAHKQALQNPEVRAAAERRKQANAEYHDQLNREMLRIDPSLKPLLDKLYEFARHNEKADF